MATYIIFDDGTSPEIMTLDAFIEANSADDAQIVEAAAAIETGLAYLGGGGASPIWAIYPFDAFTNAVAAGDLDHAARLLQDHIGQTDGGIAGMFFSDWDEPQAVWECLPEWDRAEVLRNYLEQEAKHGYPYHNIDLKELRYV